MDLLEAPHEASAPRSLAPHEESAPRTLAPAQRPRWSMAT